MCSSDLRGEVLMALSSFPEWKAYYKIIWQDASPIRKPTIGPKIMGFFKPRNSNDVITRQRQDIREVGEFACHLNADVNDLDMLWRPHETGGDFITLRGNARKMPPYSLTPIKVWQNAEVTEVEL